MDGMREYYLSFFEARGHRRVKPYPVVARWRDDIYLTIASIADFQPFVTGGLVPPPANPLTISQPCIRLDDLDSVGRSGRHLTNFEMMAHHAFNRPGVEVYWKEETVQYCDELLRSLGARLEDVTYKEEPWAGGGNAGPCLEVLVGGLELATLVFMNLEVDPGGDILIKGERYRRMDSYIVDTGYGLERFVWASQGTPTIYDAIFPGVVRELMDLAGVDYSDSEVFAQNARLAGLMDIRGQAKLLELRKRVAESIGVTVEKLRSIMEPVEAVYAIADGSRCLAFMLGDGIIPSNVKAGYLARLVLRRTLRLMAELEMEASLSEIVEMQIRSLRAFPHLGERVDVIREILDLEEERYRETLERGRRLVEKTARHFKSGIPLGELIQLYDTHGIPPEITREVAGKLGVRVELPDNFYSLVAESHSREALEEVEKKIELDPGLSPTRRLYYEDPGRETFQAEVLAVPEDGCLVLDQTLFYPEGGGQEADQGTIKVGGCTLQVWDVQLQNGIVLHYYKGECRPRVGERVEGRIDLERRAALMRHHTATHIVNDAARQVLGDHIWQAGAHKTPERARLDLSHYRRVTPREVKEIELLANKTVMADLPVEINWMERTKAEEVFGLVIYQGGVPPGREIRVLKVGGDVEACGGLHVSSTGQVGPIKILRTERIQDGVERLEYSAGIPAVKAIQEREDLLRRASLALRVTPEHLPETVNRFFEEWKDLKKENLRLKEELAEARTRVMLQEAEETGGIRLVVSEIDADPEELIKTAGQFGRYPDVVALLAGRDCKIAVGVGEKAQEAGINAGRLVREMCRILGGGGGGKPGLAQGGGTRPEKIREALDLGREMVKDALS